MPQEERAGGGDESRSRALGAVVIGRHDFEAMVTAQRNYRYRISEK
jgi:hypothetical protein